jgi:malate dehydrogenase (oxaloacetate-decarboxylating)(NADP+)
LAALGGADAMGPILLGLSKPVAALPRDASVDTIVSMTAYTVARSLPVGRVP